jgi:pimeloyl-ACP methyl ester carboxylesterase
MKIALACLLVLLVLGGGAALALYSPDKDRRALELAYGVSPADYAMAAGIRLHMLDAGPRGAPAVIMLHGFGASLQSWDGWASVLQTRFRVIRFDLPGFGLTGTDPTGDYSDARAVQVLIALMDHLGLTRASLIGNSLGGKLAWLCAAEHPDRVDKLVLVSPDGFASPGFAYGQPASVPAAAALLPYTLPAPMVRSMLAPAFGNPAALTDTRVARYRDMMLAPGVRRAMVARMAQVMLVPPEPLLRKITAPTLLVWGERDAMIPFSNAADYLKTIPRARLLALPALGHLPQEEAPTETVQPVAAFLAESP